MRRKPNVRAAIGLHGRFLSGGFAREAIVRHAGFGRKNSFVAGVDLRVEHVAFV